MKTLCQVARYLVISALALFVISGCSHPPDEEALRNQIEGIKTAISNRNTNKVMQSVSPIFMGKSGNGYTLDRKGLKRLLVGSFLRFKNLDVIVTSLNVEVFDDVEAIVTGSALLVGSGNRLPEDGQHVDFESTWISEDDEWQLIELRWK